VDVLRWLNVSAEFKDRAHKSNQIMQQKELNLEHTAIGTTYNINLSMLSRRLTLLVQKAFTIHHSAGDVVWHGSVSRCCHASLWTQMLHMIKVSEEYK
jgi:hypothetical protein